MGAVVLDRACLVQVLINALGIRQPLMLDRPHGPPAGSPQLGMGLEATGRGGRLNRLSWKLLRRRLGHDKRQSATFGKHFLANPPLHPAGGGGALRISEGIARFACAKQTCLLKSPWVR